MNSNEEAQEKDAPMYIGGELTITADPRTGGMSVSAPENMVVAMGLLEMAKVILVDRQRRQQALQDRPAIARPGAADLARLARPS